jgi:hypothetical protein
MSNYVKVVLASERRTAQPERWAPAFRLILMEGGVFKETPKFYAPDENLTFPTKEEADQWADSAARQWCAENYPDWPVNSN